MRWCSDSFLCHCLFLMLEQHQVKHEKTETKLPSVLTALSQTALYDGEADGGTVHQQGGLRQ